MSPVAPRGSGRARRCRERVPSFRPEDSPVGCGSRAAARARGVRGRDAVAAGRSCAARYRDPRVALCPAVSALDVAAAGCGRRARRSGSGRPRSRRRTEHRRARAETEFDAARSGSAAERSQRRRAGAQPRVLAQRPQRLNPGLRLLQNRGAVLRKRPGRARAVLGLLELQCLPEVLRRAGVVRRM